LRTVIRRGFELSECPLVTSVVTRVQLTIDDFIRMPKSEASRVVDCQRTHTQSRCISAISVFHHHHHHHYHRHHKRWAQRMSDSDASLITCRVVRCCPCCTVNQSRKYLTCAQKLTGRKVASSAAKYKKLNKLEGTHRVRTHAVLILNPNPNSNLDL